MDLYKEILIKLLENGEMHIVFPNLNIDITEIIKSECYQELQKIKTILYDDSLQDSECFAKIEEIICLFEELGSNGGNRHNFT